MREQQPDTDLNRLREDARRVALLGAFGFGLLLSRAIGRSRRRP